MNTSVKFYIKDSFKSTLLVFLFILVGYQSVSAQQVSGVVTDEADRPIQGVSVFIEDLNKGTITDSTGLYQLNNIPVGQHTLNFSLLGYKSRKETLQVESDSEIRLDVTLRERIFDSKEITVTGTPYAINPLETPADVDVLTGSAKLRQQETSLGASLEKMGGISNISTGGQVGKPVIRGLSGQRIRVLQDGMTMEYQQFGVRHGPNVDTFAAERIEVVRGASSVQYGTDALGGAINIIPNHIPDARGREAFLTGKMLTEYGTNNREKVGGLHLDGARAGWGFTATLIGRSAGNIHVPDIATFQETDNPEAPKFSGELNHTDYVQLNGSVGVGYTFDQGRVTADYIRWSNEQNFLLPSGEGLGQRLTNDHLHISGSVKVSKNMELEPDFSYQRNIRKSNAPGNPRSALPENGPAHLDLLLDNYTAKLDLIHDEIGIFSGRGGLEFQQQNQLTRGEEALVPSADQFNIAGFIFERAEYEDWVFNAGLRLDHRSQEAKSNQALNLPNREAGETEDVLDQSYMEFSGSLGAIYRLTNEISLASNIGRGFRAPSIFELHAEGIHGGVAAYQIGNPYLDAERSFSTDLSLRWRSDWINAKVTLYRNKIDNYIMLVNTGEFINGTPILRNQQTDAVLYGGNISFGAKINGWLKLESIFETVEGENVDDDIPSVEELPLLPATNFDIAIRFQKDQLGMLDAPYMRIKMNHTFSKEAAGRYEPFWQFGNAPQFSEFGVASTDAYTIFGMDAGFDIDIGDKTASFIVKVNNLLNTDYRSFLDTYKGYALSPGRDVSVRLVIPFGVL